jgi:hypothetical protein
MYCSLYGLFLASCMWQKIACRRWTGGKDDRKLNILAPLSSAITRKHKCPKLGGREVGYADSFP